MQISFDDMPISFDDKLVEHTKLAMSPAGCCDQAFSFKVEAGKNPKKSSAQTVRIDQIRHSVSLSSADEAQARAQAGVVKFDRVARELKRIVDQTFEDMMVEACGGPKTINLTAEEIIWKQRREGLLIGGVIRSGVSA